MKQVRRLLFWAHLVTGTIAGAVILVMCVTGAILALKPQILETIDRDVRRVEPGGRTPLPVSQVVASVRSAEPEAAIVSVAVHRDPGAAVTIAAGARTLYADPYSGAVLGAHARHPRVPPHGHGPRP